ncbi:MAG: 3-hydroxyacyl-CoA dehydrogenase family protein [Mycobacteriales bacterium]
MSEPIAGVTGPVAVIGGGRMGSGVAHALLLTGSEVRLVEASEQASEAARQRVETMVEASAQRGTLDTSPAEVLARFSVHADVEAVRGSLLVVEAVPEDPALKAGVLAAADAVLAPEALLASNTSSISIDELAACSRRPNRFLGMHFFNPVPASRLVEVVRGAQTAQEAVDTACRWVEAMAKRPIVVGDSPGFASSRLGLALGLEAIRMVETGVASAEDIDAAMTLGYKHPVGPLRLTDMVGLDVRLAIADYLSDRLGPRFEPPALLREMVEAGRLGQKSGQGFYQW